VWMVLGIGAVLVLAACGSGGSDEGAAGSGDGGSTTEPAPDGGAAPTADDLAGRTFTSASVEGYDLVADSAIRLSFDDGRLGVNAGCNQSAGAFTLEDGNLAWDGPAAATQMACPDDLMAQDAWLAGLLEQGMAATLADDELTLRSGTVTIVLSDAAPDAAPVVGTTWTLESIVDGESVSSVPADVEPPTLAVADDGTAAVFAGCNRGSGAFVLAADETTAQVGPIATTKMACEGGGSEVEASVLGVLDGEVALAVDGDQLTVTKGDAGLVYRAG
ncbi:MAG TPA: META domain-containing protein, partial [Aquihabitans sp.]|nr:META domain-containing protein [Aquihabitans sp.]